MILYKEERDTTTKINKCFRKKKAHFDLKTGKSNLNSQAAVYNKREY